MLHTGYYRELDNLRRECPDADFSFLQNEYEGTVRSAFEFLHGCCHIFACALSDRFGYEIEILTDFENQLIHTYCVAQMNGETAYIDIRGITTSEKEFFGEFGDEGVRIRNGKLDADQFDEGYLRATKYLSTASFYSMNPSLKGDAADAVCKDAASFCEANSDDYDVIYQMDSVLYGCSERVFRKELHSCSEVAQFIVKEGLNGNVRIYKDQDLFITTFGIFLDKVADPDYRDELLPFLIPLQQAHEELVSG